MKVARKDVQTCLNIWKDIRTKEFPDRIEVIYAKGSACKPWESEIDYVPVISDVDIHVRFTESNREDPLSLLDMNEAINIAQRYEEIFLNMRSHSLHLPRVQVVNVNSIIKDPTFIFPRADDIVLLYGWYENPNLVTDEFIRKLDREWILSDLSEYLKTLSEKTFDRSGLDYWIQLRSMNWRVSPTPVRLLTQFLQCSPYEIWTWNRSKIVRELIDQDLTSLVTSYQNFYLSGWKLFLSNFSETKYYRDLLKHGYSVLSKAQNILKNS
ncbi:hypothetical protein CEE45_02160 [Candidatus Heimdallarchaeota archaeon B3_Heim]|nr:MAG: hypothetical protein CEE45_02160 [Candidatus Heimdallarchaeota archaeon B3_Heim]